MTILVSTKPFPNESFCDPESTDCKEQATLRFKSADAGAVTCFTSIDGKTQPVFDKQESDGRFTATTDGVDLTLLGDIKSGTTVVVVVQGATGKGTNGRVNVGSGSSDTLQVAR